MAWQDYRNITDQEIGLIKKEDAGRSVGLDDACRFALSKNQGHPLHAESVDVCAAHLAQHIIRHNLQDDQGYEVGYAELKIPQPRYKAIVRKAFTEPKGIEYRGRRLFFK
jgi:hypothetical protein